MDSSDNFLFVVPTKERPEPINCLLTNLQNHTEANFDICVVDMGYDAKVLENNWMFRKQLERLRHQGHQYTVIPLRERNQLNGFQAGLNHATANKYKVYFGGDDDLIYDDWFFSQNMEVLRNNKDIGILVGYTHLPWQSMEEQTAPEYFLTHPDYNGTIANVEAGGYYHCSLKDPRDYNHSVGKIPLRHYEQIFGGFFCYVNDANKVGGFPLYMSPLGNRGEMILQIAIGKSGKKLTLNPNTVSWHYSVSFGGLRLVQGQERVNALKSDRHDWRAFVARGTASTAKPEKKWYDMTVQV